MEDDMLKALCALGMAGTLLVPHITPAHGMAAVDVPSSPIRLENAATLPLPRLPIGTMPWLFTPSSKGLKVDIWLNPEQQKVGPLWA
jgi:hypothetical protein